MEDVEGVNSLPTKPMYCSREYFKTSRLIQQYEKPTSDEELDHTNSEQAAFQMVMREKPINSDGQAQVECLNL